MIISRSPNTIPISYQSVWFIKRYYIIICTLTYGEPVVWQKRKFCYHFSPPASRSCMYRQTKNYRLIEFRLDGFSIFVPLPVLVMLYIIALPLGTPGVFENRKFFLPNYEWLN